MKKEPKDCINCKHNISTCMMDGGLDKRQIRKLNRKADEYGIWDKFYCNNHKFGKGKESNRYYFSKGE